MTQIRKMGDGGGTAGLPAAPKGMSDKKELKEAVDKIWESRPKKLVVSSRKVFSDRQPTESQNFAGDTEKIYEKVVVSAKDIGGKRKYQAEQFTETQVFHRNMNPHEVPSYIVSLLESGFRQLNSFSEKIEYNLKISKKGKIMIGKHLLENKKENTEDGKNADDADILSRKAEKRAAKKISATGANTVNTSSACVFPSFDVPFTPKPNPSENPHNREKKRLIREGTIVPPLVDMGIFTKDGKIVKSMGDKFRQISRFLEIVDDAVEACGFDKIRVVDFGCGKAYLTFILYYYLTYVKKIKAHMTGLDLKIDVVRKCNEAAEKYGYENLHFEVGDISVYESDEPVDMVITLHACDTATDYALYHAVNWNSRVILSVPCCQHELNGQIESDELSIFTKYGLLKERFAALATDAVRASLLEYKGYKTQVLEFVDFSHTPKNVLIRAVKSNIPTKKKEKSLREVESLIQEFHADPTLYRLLKEKSQAVNE